MLWMLCSARSRSQYALKAKNAELPPERKMEFRIGLNVGDIVVERKEIYGDGVNVAARLQALADAGGIFISGTVYDQVKNKLTLHYEDLGVQAVKNIAEPVRVWRVQMDEAAATLAATQSAFWQTQHEREPDEVLDTASSASRRTADLRLMTLSWRWGIAFFWTRGENTGTIRTSGYWVWSKGG